MRCGDCEYVRTMRVNRYERSCTILPGSPSVDRDMDCLDDAVRRRALRRDIDQRERRIADLERQLEDTP